MIMIFMLTSFSLEQNDALFIVGLGMKTLRQNMKTFILNKNVTEIKNSQIGIIVKLAEQPGLTQNKLS